MPPEPTAFATAAPLGSIAGAPSGAPAAFPGPFAPEGLRRGPPNPTAMPSVEVSRTLVKSPPELWAELEGDRLTQAVGEVEIETTEPERELSWKADGASGTARLQPPSWGPKVAPTPQVEEQVAQLG